MAAPSEVSWVSASSAISARAAWEFMHRATCPVARSLVSSLISSSAARMAKYSARVLEQKLPAMTQTSGLSRDLRTSSAPPPLQVVPPSPDQLPQTL